MSEDEKRGTIWQNDELDLIVADYFSMLSSDLSDEFYVKARHSAALMARIGRSHRSVEFKHQNISAVLDNLGLPWIPGYRPKLNYQIAIFDAIDRYISQNKAVLEVEPRPQPMPPSTSEIFVPAPVLKFSSDAVPVRLRRLVAKFDPVERDHRNRTLGRAGESFVVELEQKRLTEANRQDLAKKVRRVSADEGDGAGYDIASFDLRGRERVIEVKTTKANLSSTSLCA